MELRLVEKVSLPDQVFQQLAAEIVSGRSKPGTTVPSERTLSETLAVNRHVVREALKRLEQVGLVRITQGGGTKVLDFRRTAGLDLLAVVAENGMAYEGVVPLFRSALEMRAGIGVDIARLCAERANGRLRRELAKLCDEIEAAAPGPDVLVVDQRFWQRLLDGADNLAYQLAFNSLIRGVNALRELSVAWVLRELEQGDFRRPIARAIADRDPAAAADATRHALEPALELLTTSAEPATGAG